MITIKSIDAIGVKTYGSATYETVKVLDKKVTVEEADLSDSPKYGISVKCQVVDDDGVASNAYARVIGEINEMPFKARLVRQVAKAPWTNGEHSVAKGDVRFALIVL